MQSRWKFMATFDKEENDVPDNRIEAAIKATAQLISADDARAIKAGLGAIPADEVIDAPNPAEYCCPSYLQKTAPHLAPAFGELIGMLRDFNALFAGERTL